jgi:stress response protein YsnF
MEESVEVKRVPVNQFIEAPVPVREEGDVTIVPVFEEVLVVQKRLMLKEEIHLVRRRVETHQRQTFAVRKEEVHVLRAKPPAAEAAREGTAVAKAGSAMDGGRTKAGGS